MIQVYTKRFVFSSVDREFFRWHTIGGAGGGTRTRSLPREGLGFRDRCVYRFRHARKHGKGERYFRSPSRLWWSTYLGHAYYCPRN